MISFVLAAMSFLSVQAQHRGYVWPQEYAYGSSLELQGGFSAASYSAIGEQGRAFSMAPGGEFNIRYTYYFGRRWGFFLAGSINGSSVDSDHGLKVQNRADGGIYKYSLVSSDFNKTSLMLLQAGVAHRYDFGQWSLRPRLGVGIGGYSCSYGSYQSYTRDASQTPAWNVCSVNSRQLDYIYGETDRENQSLSDIPVFVGTASLQLTYSIGHHFFLSLEAGAKFSPNRVYCSRTTYGLMDAYDPQTWVEAVYDSDSKGSLKPDPSTKAVRDYTRFAGCMLNLSAGIGWNIGWNRYESGRYRR